MRCYFELWDILIQYAPETELSDVVYRYLCNKLPMHLIVVMCYEELIRPGY